MQLTQGASDRSQIIEKISYGYIREYKQLSLGGQSRKRYQTGSESGQRKIHIFRFAENLYGTDIFRNYRVGPQMSVFR